MQKQPYHFGQAIPRLARRVRRLARNQGGSTAVEFGLLALPFFAFIGAILETAMVFLAAQVLDSAVQDSARLIRTGQAQSGGYTITEYRNAICEGLYGLFDCTQLKLKVTELTDFTTATTTTDPVDEDTGDWDFTEAYSPGEGSSIILVEAYYKWPTYLDLFGFDLSSLPDRTRLLGAVRVFRNEPFS